MARNQGDFGSTVIDEEAHCDSVSDCLSQATITPRMINANTETVHKSISGRSLVHFKDGLELCRTLRTILKGLRECYTASTSLSDIGSGSIYIVDEGLPIPGCLIDFENGIASNVCQPVFSDELLGTRYFKSGEQLGSHPYYPHQCPPEAELLRKYYHNVEHVFWFLVFLVLYLNGPSTRREALGYRNTTSSPLSQAFRELFRRDHHVSLSNTKRDVIRYHHQFECLVLQNISKFCMPLKPLVIAFYNLLHAAYFENNFAKLASDLDSLFETYEIALSAPGGPGKPLQPLENDIHQRIDDWRRDIPPLAKPPTTCEDPNKSSHADELAKWRRKYSSGTIPRKEPLMTLASTTARAQQNHGVHKIPRLEWKSIDLSSMDLNMSPLMIPHPYAPPPSLSNPLSWDHWMASRTLFLNHYRLPEPYPSLPHRNPHLSKS